MAVFGPGYDEVECVLKAMSRCVDVLMKTVFGKQDVEFLCCRVLMVVDVDVEVPGDDDRSVAVE